MKGKSIQEIQISMINYCRKWQREYIEAVKKSIIDKTSPPRVQGKIFIIFNPHRNNEPMDTMDTSKLCDTQVGGCCKEGNSLQRT